MKKPAIIACIAFLLLTTFAAAESNFPRVKLETDKGDITLELDREKAPRTVGNFLSYVESGFYDGTLFHRVIKKFMIQGGGLTSEMVKKDTSPPVINEADNGLSNRRGTVAMARTSDPNSATAQFFINAKDNAFLDHTAKSERGWGYCVFGKVVEGWEVVEAIENVATGSRAGHRDVPTTPVVIKRVSILNLIDQPDKGSRM